MIEGGILIKGKTVDTLKYADIDTYSDHRIAMAFSVLGSRMEGGLCIRNPINVTKSFPSFYQKLKQNSVVVKKGKLKEKV